MDAEVALWIAFGALLVMFVLAEVRDHYQKKLIAEQRDLINEQAKVIVEQGVFVRLWAELGKCQEKP